MPEPAVVEEGVVEGSVEELWKLAKIFASSDFIPEHYRRKPENCFIALYTAKQLKVEPLAFMRHTYVVHGNIGIDGQMVIALANQRGFSRPIDWRIEGKGEQMKCTAFATTKGNKEVSLVLTWDTVKKEGWTRNPKWLSMPEQMFRYRTATFLTRAYCPQVLLGLPRPVDELEDTEVSVQAGSTTLDVVAAELPANEPEPVGETVGVTALKPEGHVPPPEPLVLKPDPPPPPPDPLLTEEEQQMLEDSLVEVGVKRRQVEGVVERIAGVPLDQLKASQTFALLTAVEKEFEEKKQQAK